MKHLQEYILENIIDIFEGRGGFNKYFDSSIKAIEYLKSSKMWKKYNLSEDIIELLYNKANGEVPFTIDGYNNEIKIRRFFQNTNLLDDIGSFNKSQSQFRIKNASTYLKVGDGCFSSRAKSGVNTEPQELLFCDMINNDGNVDFDLLLKKYKLDKSFIHSATKQYERIKEYIGNSSNYIAFRPANEKSELNKKLQKIYENKKVFHGASTSYITPADVYIYDKSKVNEINGIFDDLLDSFNKADDKTDYDVMFIDCKQKFITLFEEKIFIPISLKKIAGGDGHTPEKLNISEYHVNIDQNNYELKITDGGFVGNFYIENGENIKFNFRSNQKTIYPLTFEFNKKGDGGAVGKFKKFVESYIDLSSEKCELPTVDDYYSKYKENSEFNLKSFYKNKIKIAKKLKNFEDPKYDDKKLEEISNDDKLSYILIVCLLFIEFLYKLYTLRNDKNVNEFFIFIEDCYLASKKITKYSLPYLLIK